MYIGIHVKYPLLSSDFNEFSPQIFKQSSNIKFHENPSSGSQFGTCVWANITKVTVAFHNSAYTPNNIKSYYFSVMPEKTQNSAFL